MQFALCSSQIEAQGTCRSLLTLELLCRICELRAASCELQLCTLQLAARSSQVPARAASCNFAPRSSQLAARRFRHRAEKQSFARCTSHFALCSSCPGSVITSNCSSHLALCTSQYVHMSVLPGLQCAPRTSHLATHHSEPHFRRIIHRRCSNFHRNNPLHVCTSHLALRNTSLRASLPKNHSQEMIQFSQKQLFARLHLAPRTSQHISQDHTSK